MVSDVEKAATEVLFLKDGLLLPAQKETQDWKDKKTSLEEVYLHFSGMRGCHYDKSRMQKIITFPVVFLIFCLCIMNVILIYYSEVRNTPYTGQNGYRQQWQLVSDMLVNEPPEQVYAQLQADYEKTFWTNSADSGSLRTAYVQARILKEMESIVQYDEYLENIRQSTDTGHSFSRFQETENRFTRETGD